MDDLIVSPSSSSSIVSFPIATSTNTIQQKLRKLVQNQPQEWAYAVFWQTTNDESNRCVSLSWGDGHFHNKKNQLQDDNESTKFALKEIQYLFEPDNHDKAEWFFVISLTRSFTPGDGSVPGTAFASNTMIWLTGVEQLLSYKCERANEAQFHGLVTLVCIPTSNGVVEMGSYHVIEESWDLAHQAQILFGGCSAKVNMVTDDLYNSVSFADMLLMEDGLKSNEEDSLNLIDYESTSPNMLRPNMKPKEAMNTYVESASSEHSDSDCQMVPPSMTNQKKKQLDNKLPNSSRFRPVSHVEAERQRRKKLNQRFYALRSVVPNVSRMDKASLLSDAVCYINQLKEKVKHLESQMHHRNTHQGKTKKVKVEMVDTVDNHLQNSNICSVYQSTKPASSVNNKTSRSSTVKSRQVEVKIVGDVAMIRVQSGNADVNAVKLMDALREMKAQIKHASVSHVNDMMLQDVLARFPGAINEDELKSMLIWKLDRVKNNSN
ncbi:hypothetical protein E3N88_04220 [Mikania micrantha]|uniref:Transcription factor n=1 Tax=Mikania micrantha TaxID=192012 RepID=A0A5N6PUC2_9ASTR|nr:hypothetical protein E3N88_04220 [Mikania micrantha]